MSSFLKLIERKRDDLSELQLFAGVCDKALNQAARMVDTIDLVHRISAFLEEPSPYTSETELELAKASASRVEKFAESQVSNGSPYLFSLCAVRLWALLEAFVDELVVEALQCPQDCPGQAVLSKLKGPLIEFRTAPPDEQAEFLAETLKQTLDASLKLGVGRFEVLLEPLGLSGEVHSKVRKVLYELSQIRNVIVHKSGRADRRIVESCPWLDSTRGEVLHVTSKMFERYLKAAYWYLLEIRARVDERSGAKRSGQIRSALVNLEDLL